MWNKHKGGKKMKNKIFVILLIGIILLSVACRQDEEVSILLPPEKEVYITFKTTSLVYQNDGSTKYSIGGVNSSFTFSKDMLSINDNGEVRTYEVSYDQIPLTTEEFEKQFYGGDEIPDISSYKNILQYNLCSSTNDSPGYRLYILDGQYWIG